MIQLFLKLHGDIQQLKVVTTLIEQKATNMKNVSIPAAKFFLSFLKRLTIVNMRLAVSAVAFKDFDIKSLGPKVERVCEAHPVVL